MAHVALRRLHARWRCPTRHWPTFCHITNNWRGRPLLSRQVVLNLIGSVTTAQGLRVKAALDENVYDASVKVSDAELSAITIERDEFHGEWTCRISPRRVSQMSTVSKLFLLAS